MAICKIIITFANCKKSHYYKATLMDFTTKIDIPQSNFALNPEDRMLFVGSCFAENMGRRLADNALRCQTNPYGTMYNPASIMHSVERAISDGLLNDGIDVAVFTLGTNHVYILKETNEIVDNCQKRPQRLFREEELSIEDCKMYIMKAIDALRNINPDVKVIITVSPIRYRKYGFHESQLSKATLLLAADMVAKMDNVEYFPAYEIVNDELRDYRFYAPDMIHPSEQAVDYIYERFSDTFFSKQTHQMIREWAPIKAALNHRPFNPESEEYKAFIADARQKEYDFKMKYNISNHR